MPTSLRHFAIRIRVIAAVTALVFVVIGCGGSDSAPTAAPTGSAPVSASPTTNQVEVSESEAADSGSENVDAPAVSPTAPALAPTTAANPTPTVLADTAPPPLPDVTASTVAGGQIDFGSLQGQDTVLWFWAPW